MKDEAGYVGPGVSCRWIDAICLYMRMRWCVDAKVWVFWVWFALLYILRAVSHLGVLQAPTASLNFSFPNKSLIAVLLGLARAFPIS